MSAVTFFRNYIEPHSSVQDFRSIGMTMILTAQSHRWIECVWYHLAGDTEVCDLANSRNERVVLRLEEARLEWNKHISINYCG